MSNRAKLFGECYQLAGALLLTPPDLYTAGQRDRLIEVLLNALSEPEKHNAKMVRHNRALALKP